MDWRVSGEYLMACTCTRDVHWPIDGSLSDSNGACTSVTAFRIREGHYWDSDLSGMKYAVFNFFPARISTGDWQMGVVLEEDAGYGQTMGIEAIARGTEGGPMSALAGLIGEYIGTDRGAIGWLEGERPYLAIEGRGHFTFFPTLVDGVPVQAANSMWVFAEQYRIGRAEGRLTAFGRTLSAAYGESGTFSFTSENTGMEREFRPSRLGGIFGLSDRGKHPGDASDTDGT